MCWCCSCVLFCGVSHSNHSPGVRRGPVTRVLAAVRMLIMLTALAVLSSTEGQSQLLFLLAMTTVFLLLRIFCDLLTLELQKELHTESRHRRCCGMGLAQDGGLCRDGSELPVLRRERQRQRPQGNSFLNCHVQTSPSKDRR